MQEQSFVTRIEIAKNLKSIIKDNINSERIRREQPTFKFKVFKIIDTEASEAAEEIGYGALYGVFAKREADFFAALRKQSCKGVINTRVQLVKSAINSFENLCAGAEKLFPDEIMYCGWRALRINNDEYESTTINANMTNIFEKHHKIGLDIIAIIFRIGSIVENHFFLDDEFEPDGHPLSGQNAEGARELAELLEELSPEDLDTQTQTQTQDTQTRDTQTQDTQTQDF
ncbi:unnamed protein product [Mucor hiemalis]